MLEPKKDDLSAKETRTNRTKGNGLKTTRRLHFSGQ